MDSGDQNEDNFIVAENLRKNFDGLSVLHNISFKIDSGKIVSFLGPSGSGKTTLLSIVAGLLRPDSGTIQVQGKNPVDLLGTGKISFVFQDDTLLPWRNVFENTILPIELKRKPHENDKKKAKQLLELVDLSDFSESLPHELSGGMKRRVSLARALISNPSFVILDEPFGALDELLRRELMIEFEAIWRRENLTTILVTHSVAEAVFLSDEIHLLSERPAKIFETISIDVPRPRGSDFFKSEEFQSLSNTIFDCLLKMEARL